MMSPSPSIMTDTLLKEDTASQCGQGDAGGCPDAVGNAEAHSLVQGQCEQSEGQEVPDADRASAPCGQAQYIERPVPSRATDDPISRLLEWALGRLGEPLTIDRLAAQAHLSRRTFVRSFRARNRYDAGSVDTRPPPRRSASAARDHRPVDRPGLRRLRIRQCRHPAPELRCRLFHDAHRIPATV